MGSIASIFTQKEVIKKPAKVAGFLIQKKALCRGILFPCKHFMT